jgi:WD40 repeat protein
LSQEFLAKSLQLDPNALSPAKVQHDQGLLALFGAATTAGDPILVSWGKDGRILGRWLKAPSTSYLLGDVGKGVSVIAFSSAAGLVAGADSNGIFVRSIVGSGEEFRLQRLMTRVAVFEFSPEGDSLLIGGADGMVYLWRFKDEAMRLERDRPEWYLQRYPGLGTAVSSLKFHPNGKFFFGADLRGTVSAWQRYGLDDLRGRYDDNFSGDKFLTSKTVRTPVRLGAGVAVDKIAIDPSNQFVAFGLQDGVIEIWKLRGIVYQHQVKAHDGQILDLDFSNAKAGELLLISAGKDGELKSWLGQIKDEKRVVGKNVVGGTPGQEYIVQTMKLSPKKSISMSGVVTGTFIPDEGYFVGSRTGTISLVDLSL